MKNKDLKDYQKIKYQIDELKQKLASVTNAKFRLKESNINTNSEFYKGILDQEKIDKKKLAGLINKITFINDTPSEKE